MWSGVRERTARRAQRGGCRSLIPPASSPRPTLPTRLRPLLTSHHPRRQPRSLHRRRVLESSKADIDPRRRMDPVSMAVLATERDRGVNVSTFFLAKSRSESLQSPDCFRLAIQRPCRNVLRLADVDRGECIRRSPAAALLVLKRRL